MTDEDMDTDDVAPEYEPSGPRPILQLSKSVINQIAAAEIIHRPANAIKELLENSLDAGSTSIKITLKEGGLKSLQITDNGHGIRKEDLPLLCTRYATSKLREFEDLQSLHTYGFRGEALASISYCSHVEVITKTKEDSCGWRASYSEGVLISPKPGISADPKPAAANDGTVITAEDLFYNMPLRKRAFRSPNDEYNRVLDVVMKYAIHNPHVSWQCKKTGSSMPDLSTPANSTARSNIALLYTSALANELLEVKETVFDEKLGAKCRGWISGANTNWTRKGGWLLFINNSTKIRRALDSLYTAYLPKGSTPWIYLSLDIDPTKIDVNVSPTKAEVHFLNEDEMVESIVGAVQSALLKANTSRTFSVQTVLPSVNGTQQPSTSSTTQKKPAPNYKVRTDTTVRTLPSMIPVSNPSQLSQFSESQRPAKRRAFLDDSFELENEDIQIWDSATAEESKNVEIEESHCEFTSIVELRRTAKKRNNPDLEETMSKHSFVGIVDEEIGMSCIQHGTKLFLVNHLALADEHFYQIGLRQFGAFHRLILDPPPPLKELLRVAAEEEPLGEHGLDVDMVISRISDLLMDKREMMDEYFSLKISDQGNIETLPMVLRGYTPNLDRLPHFLLYLGTEVDWDSEKPCFSSLLRELAYFYSPRPSGYEVSPAEADHQRWQLEHVLFPSFRRYTAWPRDFLGKEVKQIANLPDLFRIFERC